MKRVLTLIALLLTVTGIVAGPATAADAAPGTIVVRLQAFDHELLVRLNATRVSRGLRPLVLSNQLQEAAVSHSRSMLEGGFFAHESRDGSSFTMRIKRYYRPSGFHTWSAGENLLCNTARLDAGTAIEAWLDSPAHRDNMLDPGWREVGIGSLHASSAGGTFGGGPVWVVTMDFGARTGGGGGKTSTVLAVKAKPKQAAAQAKPGTSKPKAAKPTKPTKPVKREVDRVLPLPSGSGQAGQDADAGPVEP